MNDAFEDREKAFETKFKLDQETTFKVEARRNKLNQRSKIMLKR